MYDINIYQFPVNSCHETSYLYCDQIQVGNIDCIGKMVWATVTLEEHFKCFSLFFFTVFILYCLNYSKINNNYKMKIIRNQTGIETNDK